MTRPDAPLDPASLSVAGLAIADLQTALREGRLSSAALVSAALDRIARLDRQGPQLRALSHLSPNALADARASDARRRAGSAIGVLEGIPILVKDNMDVAGWPTAAGALALAGMVARRDAEIVARLRAAGAILLGKTAMHELAAGITGASSLTGYARNAYAPDRSPGGSSSGAAVAVAAGYVLAAIGSDTAGSVRIPAAFNNLFGLRAPRGAIPLAGIVPLSPTQDMPGVLARNADDLALVTAVLADDATLASVAEVAPRDLTVGVLDDDFDYASPEAQQVTRVVRDALAMFEAAGARLRPVALDGLREQADAANVIVYEFAEALRADLAARGNAPVRSLDDILEHGLHHWQMEDTLRLRAQHEGTASPAYHAAIAAQAELRDRVLALFASRSLSVIAYPTVRTVPALLGGVQAGSNSLLSPVTGLASITLPAGFTPDGLPVGLELLAPATGTALLLGIARAWQRLRVSWRAPPVLRSPSDGRIVRYASHAGDDLSVNLTLVFDIATSQFAWHGRIDCVAGSDLLAATLHRFGEGASQAAVLALAERGRAALAGSALLTGAPRVWFLDGELVLRILTRANPTAGVIIALQTAAPSAPA